MRLIFIFVFVWQASAQVDPADLLKRLRQRVAGDLARLPNYTCGLTIDREMKTAKEKKFSALDTVRLDVALIGGKELYAWRGSSNFDERSIGELVPGHGAIGTGGFALHLRALFVKTGAEFTFRGETEWSGRKAVRYDFRISRQRSECAVSDGVHSALSPYHGSFWVDPEKLDLLRLEMFFDEVPPPVRVRGAHNIIDYARMKIGDEEFLLPQGGELWLSSDREESHNRTRYDHCRQYATGSVISFGDPPPLMDAPKPVRTVTLPAGLALELRLDTALEQGKIAVGDPVTATLTKAITRNGEVLLPKGAKLNGHMTRLEQHRATNFDYKAIGVMFESVEAEGLRGGFAGVLEDAGMSAGGEYHVPFRSPVGAPLNVWTNFRHRTQPPKPNEGVFYVRTHQLRIRAGLRMMWRTVATTPAR